MTTSSTFITSEHEETALTLKALAHPARLAILDYLSQHKSCYCGDLTPQLPLAQSTVSQHLKALKEAQLIDGTIEGVRSCYCISQKGMELMQTKVIPLLHRMNTTVSQKCC